MRSLSHFLYLTQGWKETSSNSLIMIVKMILTLYYISHLGFMKDMVRSGIPVSLTAQSM